MANSYKAAGRVAGTNWTQAYIVPASTTGILQNIHVVNTTPDVRQVSLRWKDSSANGGTAYYLVYQMTVPSGIPTNLIDKALVLEAGDSLEVMCDVADALHLTYAALEVS